MILVSERHCPESVNKYYEDQQSEPGALGHTTTKRDKIGQYVLPCEIW